MEKLRAELRAYYQQYRADAKPFPMDNQRIRQSIVDEMEAYHQAHPNEHPSLLKARLHEVMAERFVPVIFTQTPFFFEMGLRFAENWGTPSSTADHVGSWMFNVQSPRFADKPEWQYITAFNRANVGSEINVWNIWSGFDNDHHTLGYTHIFRVGVQGLLAEISARRATSCTEDQAANLLAMERSCYAVLRIAARFAEAAAQRRAVERDPQAREFLAMMAQAAQRIPANPPQTFYEGLAMLWFLREVTATLESIGISVLGHIDRLLYPLYRDDLAAGRIDEAQARDLLARWMLPTDIKFHVEDNAWPETSTCLELGGCDEHGIPVWNAVTRLTIETHQQLGLMNPKLNCRFSAQAPQAYLDLISSAILQGHNQFALLNDDAIIPACVRTGKSEREARLYVNGGCQETIVEGVEHSAGAYYYFCMPRVLDLCLQAQPLSIEVPEAVRPYIPSVITEAPTFTDFYRQFMDQLKTTIRIGGEWSRVVGQEQWRINPCPFFSASLDGCIAHGADYTRGGAKYNPSGIALVGLGTVIDSLSAVHTAVYERQWLSLEALQHCLAHNWDGEELLRARIMRLPKFGHGDPQVDALTAEFTRELGEFIRTIPAERGGTFQGSLFVYYAFHWFAPHVRATPDGRKVGEVLSQGVAPHRSTPPEHLMDVYRTLSHIDFHNYPGNSVLDVQLPMGSAIAPAILSAVTRTFAQFGGPTLQPNCVSLAELRDAQCHPDRHAALTVRISGLSARFVCLSREMQDEIISRAMLTI